MKDPLAVQGVCLGLLMLSAYFCGRLTHKLRLGQMIGQLLGGVFVGPYFLEAIGVLDKLHMQGYHAAFDSFHFVIFTFLGVIAFALGEELHVDRLRRVGRKSAWISLIQALFTWVVLTATFFAFGLDWPIALVIGSIGVATAPAITFVLLNSLEIEGRFRNMVANILVLDDVLEVILFSVFVQIAINHYHGEAVHLTEILTNLGTEFGLALLLGGGLFVFLRLVVRSPQKEQVHVATLGPGFVSRLLTAHPTPSVEVLVIVFGSVAIVSGIGLGLHLPFLVIGVFAGVLIANLHTHALFDSLKIDNVMPLLNLVFFAMIGANIRLDVFSGGHLWLVFAYIVARGGAKLAGTWLGCKITGQDPKVQAALPFLMLPQAGVAAVEAVYVVRLLGERGQIVADVVLPALVCFEIAGVFLSERTLLKWRQWTMGEAEVLPKRRKVLRESFAEEAAVVDEFAEFVPAGFEGAPLAASSLRQAVEMLAMRLEHSGLIPDADTVVDRTMARERIASTAIGSGVALPHCKVIGQEGTLCAIGVLDKPLRQPQPPDGLPLNLVVLLVSPVHRPDDHLRALAMTARVFANDAFRTQYIDAVRSGHAGHVLRPMRAEG